LLPSSFFYRAPPHSSLPSFPTRRSSDFITSAPATTSLWPLRYLVRLCATTSKPSSSGRWKNGVAKVLSQTETIPRFRQISATARSEEHTSELQSRGHLVCRLLLEKKNNI